jgi:hypothetical protein
MVGTETQNSALTLPKSSDGQSRRARFFALRTRMEFAAKIVFALALTLAAGALLAGISMMLGANDIVETYPTIFMSP